MYKQHYLEELAARYSEGQMGDMVAPPLPDWCFEEEEEASEGEEPGEGGDRKRKSGEENGVKTKKKRIEHDNQVDD